jgi:hypothetical protein
LEDRARPQCVHDTAVSDPKAKTSGNPVESRSGSKKQSLPFTREALEGQNTVSAHENWTEEEERRMNRVQSAARDLGFDLPRHNLQKDAFELYPWLGLPSGNKEKKRGKS